jgi:hypothetical protein
VIGRQREIRSSWLDPLAVLVLVCILTAHGSVWHILHYGDLYYE